MKQRRTWSCLIFTHLAGHQNFNDLYVTVQAGFATVDGNSNENDIKEKNPVMVVGLCWVKSGGNSGLTPLITHHCCWVEKP